VIDGIGDKIKSFPVVGNKIKSSRVDDLILSLNPGKNRKKSTPLFPKNNIYNLQWLEVNEKVDDGDGDPECKVHGMYGQTRVVAAHHDWRSCWC
jgi:hypothetical protein